MSLNNFITLSRLEVESICATKKTAKEFCGPCPSCKSGSRFCWWPDGGKYWDFFCFDCELHGFVVDRNGHSPRFDPAWQDEWRRKQSEQMAQEERRRKKLADKLNRQQTHVQYHQNLNGHSQYIGEKWGLTQETIDARMIGYAESCPTFSKSDSLTIPWFDGEKVVEIRHRLLQPEPGKGKYRTQWSGPFNGLFNINSLRNEDDWIILTEGEFKAITLEQYGLPAVAVPGITCFQAEWAEDFAHLGQVFIVFDPGQPEREWAERTAYMLTPAGVTARIVEVPDKIDDLLVHYGMDIGQLSLYLESGRVIHA